MALATTTLSATISASDVKIVVASATSMAAGRTILIDQEVMQVTKDYVSGTTVGVLRGLDGTAAVAHFLTSAVTHGLQTDFDNPAVGTSTGYPTVRATLVQSITTTSTSLVLPPSGCDLRVVINLATAISLTIPVPTKDMDGTILTFVASAIAVQHALIFTGGLNGGSTGYTTFTAAATGSTAFSVIACNGMWFVMSGPAWTGTVTKLIGAVS
jgi:hypothetical protein